MLDVFNDHSDDVMRPRIAIADAPINSGSSVDDKLSTTQLENKDRALIAERSISLMRLPMSGL